jgi:hypothetical protein
VRVHTFVCLVALLLSRLVERESRQAGFQGSLSGLFDLLAAIRLAMILQPSAKKGGRPRCQWGLEECEAPALYLFQQVVPQKPPFVYTPLSF